MRVHQYSMATLLTSTLLLLTILAAFAFGIAAGYWVIYGFLHLLNSSDTRKQASQPVLASSAIFASSAFHAFALLS